MKTLANRMKDYENVFRDKMPKRNPVIIRIDGKAFHTYTKGMNKPYDEKLAKAFWETSKYLCENIGGCKIAYHQSDEISLLITDYEKLTSEAWFDNNIQKMVSVAASMATLAFNRYMNNGKDGLFDARAFILPKEEVNNYFLWRQRDAIKNSISMLAQYHFSQRELQGLNGKQLIEKLASEKEIYWNDLETWKKSGLCISKKTYLKETHLKEFVTRSHWIENQNTPLFSDNPGFIEKYVY